MADSLQPSRSSFSGDEINESNEASSPNSYAVLLRTIKIEDSLDSAEEQKRIKPFSSEDDSSIEVDEWTEIKEDATTAFAMGGTAEQKKTDVKKEVLVKNELQEEKENKPRIQSSPGSAKGEWYYRALKRATEFLKDVKRELFFTNPSAYQQFLDIFQKSKQNREDLTDRLRVVAEAKDVIGHRADLMQRLVELAMSDLHDHSQPLRPLQPLVATDVRGLKNMGFNVKKE